MRSNTALLIASAVLLLGVLLPVSAHGDEAEGPAAAAQPNDPGVIAHSQPSYFRHEHYGGWASAHTILMIGSWVFVMPVAVMLSVARSRYHLPAQVGFHVLNGLGVFTGFVYNHSTPDLYENNAHHPIGWVVTSFTVAWTLLSFYVAFDEYRNNKHASLAREQSMTVENMARHAQFHPYSDSVSQRYSRDSGQGTERDSASLLGSRQNSSDSVGLKREMPSRDLDLESEDNESAHERRGFLGNNAVGRFVSQGVHRFSSQRVTQTIRFVQIISEKVLLLLGFLALTSGFVVYGGIFRNRQIFSGLAHFVKGGIFFWYGLLTLGRWMGAFTEFGWAWNNRPNHPVVAKWKTVVPSAEFTESFVIWLYGASNVFLEHLNAWGRAWAPSDFEHLSITALFFGGGLLGMLIESRSARELLNTTVVVQKTRDDELASSSAAAAAAAATSRFAAAASSAAAKDPDQRWELPNTYRIPLNPMPGLTIMLLGIMMSSHHQKSMVSTMMHAQWGGLFTAFAVARAVTYITLYLKPPTSHFPSRPPSELVAAFCLTAGGFMFMMSATDGVWAIESNGLDAMTIFTVTMGLSGILLAWEVVVFAIKGWAVRKERIAAGHPLA